MADSSTRWTGQTRLTNSKAAIHVSQEVICSHYAPGFSCEQSTHTSISTLPVKPPPQQISTQALAKIHTHPQQSSKILQLHHYHTLNFPFSARNSWPSPHITLRSSYSVVSTHHFCDKKIPSGNQTKASEVGSWRHNHHATNHRSPINFKFNSLFIPNTKSWTRATSFH